jgi:hypothetical protein
MNRRLLALLSIATLVLTGCGGAYAPPGSSGSGSGGSAATFLYTAVTPTLTSGAVNSYPVASTGTAVAAASSIPFSTLLGGVRGDGAGHIYVLVAPFLASTFLINVYSTTAGALTLTRSFAYTIASGNPASFAVDPTGIVYVSVTNTGSSNTPLLKFAATASGTATPTIIPSNSFFMTMATDAAGNLYGYNGNVQEFLSGFTSTTTPAKTISFSGTPFTPVDMAVDASDNLYFAGFVLTTPGIIEFPSTNGTVSAIRTIMGSSTLFAAGPFQGIALDAAGNIYVSQNLATGVPHLNGIYSFAPTANGNVAPTNDFTLAAMSTGTAVTGTGFFGLVAY